MKKIVKEDLKIEQFTLPREEAIALMKEKKALQSRIDRRSSGRCSDFFLQAGRIYRSLCRAHTLQHKISQGI